MQQLLQSTAPLSGKCVDKHQNILRSRPYCLISLALVHSNQDNRVEACTAASQLGLLATLAWKFEGIPGLMLGA